MSAPETARCPNCFSATTTTPCPHCGWQPSHDNPPPALALGRVLDGRYRVGRVLGHGGFGITYLAWDDNLQLRLAIKEYLPRDCVSRGPDGVSLAIYSGQAGDQFTYGLDRFLEEARTLAHFDQHPGIVTVKNFFRAHGTGYCVMDYVEGITLRQYLDQQPGGRIGIEAALKLLTPVMDALRAVHKEGLLHRDIAPDNIYLTQDGRIKLLDFGAARFAASEHSKSLSIILKPGYSPEEQYRAKGKQGPWTDVYGLAATCYRAITGQVPPESLDRLDNDDLVPPSRLGMAITPSQEATLLKALAVKAGQRFQGMAELQEAWRSGAPPSLQPYVEQGEPAKAPVVVAPPTPVLKKGHAGLVLASAGGLALLAVVGFGLWHLGIPPPPPTPGAPTSQPATAATSPQTTATVPVATPQPPLPPVPENSAARVAEGKRAFDQGNYELARTIFSPLAEAGDAQAQFYLGRMFAEGRGIAKDETKGANWYRKSAEQGDSSGQYNLGIAYAKGQGVTQDAAAAVRWVRKAADQGLADAQVALGTMYHSGQGVAPDVAEAVRWYRMAAEQGLALGQNNLGAMYQNGQGVAQDAVEAVRWYRMAAEQGLAVAQSNLGGMYAIGQGVTQDAAEAVSWLRKAADQGYVDALFKLGLMYTGGIGVAKDATEGVRWFHKAAETGPDAQVALGQMYLAGLGVAQDGAEGISWYRKAAEQGHARAQFALGWQYAMGGLVVQDDVEAVRWYRKAAEQGLADGQVSLGQMYAEGQGVIQDEAEAVRWYRKAADQGDSSGEYNLGVAYAKGLGVTQDMAAAVRWYRKAAEQGDPMAKIALQELELDTLRRAAPATAVTTAPAAPSVPTTPAAATPPAATPEPHPAPTAPGEKAPLYFAAESAPTANIPPEAPLCYKYLVAGPEEQLRKLKTKYPGLYQDKISTNPQGGKNLVAKRQDGTGKEISYFYSTSPGVCNDYQKDRLQTIAKSGDKGSANTDSPPGGASAPTDGASSNGRYRFLGKDQEIVEDTRTKLQWQRCSLGQTWNGATCTGKAVSYKWDGAQRVGPAGWRLPTKEELDSLVYCSSGEPGYWWRSAFGMCEGAYGSPTIWSAAFPNTPDSSFWSSSPYASPYAFNSSHAWRVNFNNGHVQDNHTDSSFYVRLVRGGQ